MKFICQFTLSLLLFLAPVAFAATTVTAQLTHLLAGFNSYQAHFDQVTKDSKQHIVQKSSGIFSLMRPDKFKWHQKTPSEQIITSDGHRVWIYDVDLMQVTKHPLNRNSINPALMLAGDLQGIEHQFTVTLLSSSLHHHSFKLIPKKETAKFKSVSLFFANKRLIKIQLINNLSQVSTFNFNHVKINSIKSRRFFQFTVPHGVQVLSSQ